MGLKKVILFFMFCYIYSGSPLSCSEDFLFIEKIDRPLSVEDQSDSEEENDFQSRHISKYDEIIAKIDHYEDSLADPSLGKTEHEVILDLSDTAFSDQETSNILKKLNGLIQCGQKTDLYKDAQNIKKLNPDFIKGDIAHVPSIFSRKTSLVQYGGFAKCTVIRIESICFNSQSVKMIDDTTCRIQNSPNVSAAVGQYIHGVSLKTNDPLWNDAYERNCVSMIERIEQMLPTKATLCAIMFMMTLMRRG
jgi:hypothetical protein